MMARPRQQRGRPRSGGLVAAAVLLTALLSLCLARADAAAAAADSHDVAGPEWRKGVVVAAAEKIAEQDQEAAAEGEEGPAVVPERVAMEINDYPGYGANSKHVPHP